MYIDLITIDLCPGQGGVRPSGTIELSRNGEYNVYSYASASVNVHPSTSLSETYTSNGSYNISGEFNGGLITIEVPSPQFITETLSVSENGTYTPGTGVDGFSQVTVDVPQSVTGYTEREVIEKTFNIVNLNNSASYVASYAFYSDGTIETVSLPNCSNVNEFAFMNNFKLTSVNLPECVSITNNAFYGCRSLLEVSLPKCSYIRNSVFGYCKSLTTVTLPKCSYIGERALYGNDSLSQVSLPVLQSTANSVFQDCRSLNNLTLCTDVYWTIPYNNRLIWNTPIIGGNGSIYVRSETYSNWIVSIGWSSLSSVFVSVEYSEPALSFSDGLVYGTTPVLRSSDYLTYLGISKGDVTGLSFSRLTSIEEQTFYNCTSLSEISLPECNYVGVNAFTACTSLTKITLPKCSYIGQAAFNWCSSLSQVELQDCEFMSDRAFYSCINLSAFTISGSSVCTIYGYNHFINTPIASGTGSIYVPASLVDAYKAADNWSQYASQIFPIPE